MKELQEKLREKNQALEVHFCLFDSWRVRVMLSNATFSYVVAVSFIGGGNGSARRKPPEKMNKSFLANLVQRLSVAAVSSSSSFSFYIGLGTLKPSVV